MEKNHPSDAFFITARKWGVLAYTIYVIDEKGARHVFTIGKTVEGYVAYGETDNPLEMKSITRNEINEVTNVLKILSETINAQLAQFVAKPQLNFQ
jgi:hypothetical protein